MKLQGTISVCLAAVMAVSCTGKTQVRELAPTSPPVQAITRQTSNQAQDEQVYTVAFSEYTTVLDTGIGIVEGAVEVRFQRDESGVIVRLPSGRPAIKDEDIMLDLARANLQQNFARFMQGTVAEGVSVAVAEYLRNTVPEPQVKSFQENISRIAYSHELPRLIEREQVLRGNLLIVRADAREVARREAKRISMMALEEALAQGVFDHSRSNAAIDRALEGLGL